MTRDRQALTLLSAAKDDECRPTFSSVRRRSTVHRSASNVDLGKTLGIQLPVLHLTQLGSTHWAFQNPKYLNVCTECTMMWFSVVLCLWEVFDTPDQHFVSFSHRLPCKMVSVALALSFRTCQWIVITERWTKYHCLQATINCCYVNNDEIQSCCWRFAEFCNRYKGIGLVVKFQVLDQTQTIVMFTTQQNTPWTFTFWLAFACD